VFLVVVSSLFKYVLESFVYHKDWNLLTDGSVLQDFSIAWDSEFGSNLP